MANSPQSSHHKPIDFRAPPPSPVAPGHPSPVANDHLLTDFLQHSLRVPHLILPDRVFPRQKSIHNPPKLDFQYLSKNYSIAQLVDSIAHTGCFELVNHGISTDLIRSVANSAGAGIFKLRPEQKAAISRSNDRLYGFVEFHGGDLEERETSDEEFVWCREEAFKLEMEGIWPAGYTNFSEKIEMLLWEIEKVAKYLWELLEENITHKLNGEIIDDQEETNAAAASSSVCYLYKHHCGNKDDEEEEDISTSSSSVIRHDVIRRLIRGSECSHALCLHVCHGSSEFHVYSKKGWVSFSPNPQSLIITIGDLLQAWSGGQYKHVIGRPIFKGEEDCISMAFLYSPPPSSIITNQNNTISLVHQFFFLLFLTIFYNFWVFLF